MYQPRRSYEQRRHDAEHNEQERVQHILNEARQTRLERALAEERSRMDPTQLWSHISATSSSSSALSTTNVDRSMLHPSTVPPSPPSKLQPGHPIVLQPAAADAAGVGTDEPSPTTACFERWACARAPPAPAASAAPPPAQEAEIAADDDEMGKWHIDRLYVGSTARYIADRMEMPNAFFCSVFLLAFILVETQLARETQYQTLFIIFSPIALMWSTAYVLLQLLVLFEEESLIPALKGYLIRFWNPCDLIIVIVLWAKFHDSFSIAQSEPDPRGFESITNDNKATEWYFLLALRAFHLVGLFRTLAAQSEQLTQLWHDVAPADLVNLLNELYGTSEDNDTTPVDREATLPEVRITVTQETPQPGADTVPTPL